MKKYVIYAWVASFFLLSAMIAVGPRFNFHREFKDAPAQIEGCTDPAVTAVIYSIRNYPNSWGYDNFKMWHGSDVSIWTANEDYGLSLTLGSKDAHPDEYKIDDQCRAVLYGTTQNWLRNTINEKLRS